MILKRIGWLLVGAVLTMLALGAAVVAFINLRNGFQPQWREWGAIVQPTGVRYAINYAAVALTAGWCAV
jgi:hypothetical protein